MTALPPILYENLGLLPVSGILLPGFVQLEYAADISAAGDWVMQDNNQLITDNNGAILAAGTSHWNGPPFVVVRTDWTPSADTINTLLVTNGSGGADMLVTTANEWVTVPSGATAVSAQTTEDDPTLPPAVTRLIYGTNVTGETGLTYTGTGVGSWIKNASLPLTQTKNL